MNNHTNPPPLLTPGQVADVFRVTTKTVTRWAQSGMLPCVQGVTPDGNPGHRRYRRSDVDALIGDGRAAVSIIRELLDEGYDVKFGIDGDGDYEAAVIGDRRDAYHGYGPSPEAALTDAWRKRNGSEVQR